MLVTLFLPVALDMWKVKIIRETKLYESTKKKIQVKVRHHQDNTGWRYRLVCIVGNIRLLAVGTMICIY
jgi:hypothetical protein